MSLVLIFLLVYREAGGGGSLLVPPVVFSVALAAEKIIFLLLVHLIAAARALVAGAIEVDHVSAGKRRIPVAERFRSHRRKLHVTVAAGLKLVLDNHVVRSRERLYEKATGKEQTRHKKFYIFHLRYLLTFAEN